MMPPPPITLADELAWLAGIQPRLLAHAYPDRIRFASLGLSVAVAAALTGTGLALVAGQAVGRGTGWLVLPLATAATAYGLRLALAWVWRGQQFGRRLGLVALGLAGGALALAAPLVQVLLGPLADVPTAADSSGAMRWAIRLVVLCVLLVPAYGTATARHGSYARLRATGRAFDALFTA